ncbi:MAG: DUF2231 domain-containing protein [Gemmatimonadales bacterium]
MFGYDLPRLHAAVNDLPVALLIAAVLFDLIGWAMKRESLVWAGIWTLWAGVIGGWVAVIAGELAENSLDHGEAIHDLMKSHETLAIATMCVFTVVLTWKLWRRFDVNRLEDRFLKVLSLAGLVLLVRTGTVGGDLMFDRAAGIPTEKMQAEILNRGAGHAHQPGEPEHDHGPMTPDSTPGDSATTHVDPPGTPPHKH